MKKAIQITTIFLFLILLFPGCHPSEQILTPFSGKTLFIGPAREITALQELFPASSSNEMKNVHIIIDEGNYISENEIWVSGENIIIEGKGTVNLYCTALYENVIWITGNNISIKNMRMKHLAPGEPEGQNCSGRVIGFDIASNVLIEGCDLNGCGLAGLHDNLGNANILIRNNYIHNNSLGAYTDIDGGVWLEEVENHPVFRFENNRMENNGADRVVEKDTLLLDK